jgi:ribosomal-protein-alanine N-acetyltransferase
MVEYVISNREHLAPWEPFRPDDYYTLDFWSDRFSSGNEEIASDRSLFLVLLNRMNPSGAIIGQIGLSNITRGAFQAAHLGYSLDQNAVGKGLMCEALTVVIEYVFEELNLHRVMANYSPRNERSGKLLRRLGFTVEGYARDYLRLAGTWEDHILTSLVNPSWKDR